MPISQVILDAFVEAQLAAAQGREWAKTITIADRTTTFHGLDEIAAYIKQMQALAGVSRTRYAATSKGLR